MVYCKLTATVYFTVWSQSYTVKKAWPQCIWVNQTLCCWRIRKSLVNKWPKRYDYHKTSFGCHVYLNCGVSQTRTLKKILFNICGIYVCIVRYIFILSLFTCHVNLNNLCPRILKCPSWHRTVIVFLCILVVVMC